MIMRIFLMTLAAILIPSCASSPSTTRNASAVTYRDAFTHSTVLTMSRLDDAIPDDAERAYWRCWASGFVDTQVSAKDLPRLDRLAAAGNWTDQLAVVYGAAASAGMLGRDATVQSAVSEYMAKNCPTTLDHGALALDPKNFLQMMKLMTRAANPPAASDLNDDIEMGYWDCLVETMVEDLVPAGDRAKLDATTRKGGFMGNDPLVKKYETVFANAANGPGAAGLLDHATARCPAEMEAWRRSFANR